MDRRRDKQTDTRRTKWSLCATMLRRRHKNMYLNQGILWICQGRGHQNGPMAPFLIKCIIYKIDKIKGPFAKTGGHQGKWRGWWTLIWGPRPKLTAYLDRLYRGPFHFWSSISSILHSFLINWQWPFPGLSLLNGRPLMVKRMSHCVIPIYVTSYDPCATAATAYNFTSGVCQLSACRNISTSLEQRFYGVVSVAWHYVRHALYARLREKLIVWEKLNSVKWHQFHKKLHHFGSTIQCSGR